jgi:hypothetical protein
VEHEHPHEPHAEVDDEEDAAVHEQPAPQPAGLVQRARKPAHHQVDQDDIHDQPDIVQELADAVVGRERQHADDDAVDRSAYRRGEVPVERVDPKPAAANGDVAYCTHGRDGERGEQEHFGQWDPTQADGPRRRIALTGDPDLIDGTDVVGEADERQAEEEDATPAPQLRGAVRGPSVTHRRP